MTAEDEAARRLTFDRDKVCYEQNFQQYRSMNQIMWQVPLLAISITGGIWFAALNVKAAEAFQALLFCLSAVLDVVLIAVLWRVRHVMSAYMEKIKAFNPSAFVETSGNGWFNRPHTVIWAFTLALGLAAVGSVFALLHVIRS
jgi:hypothetical protein